MNYPVWNLTMVGGSTLIAVISILHVYIAHFAVGGGFFIWFTDLKGFRENNPSIHEYLKKHIWFFLLITMVFGAVSGVGIWFVISLVNPSATSVLIHNFVFAWSIEWIFFLGEIISLLVLYHKFETLPKENRLKLGLIYFILAWLSLFAVNGILSFMLTPGKWIETGSFWSGFFNISFLPTLVFRTILSAMIAGIFSFVTTLKIDETQLKKMMVSYSGKWVILSGLALIPSSIWCYFSIPDELRETSFHLNPQTSPMSILFIISLFVIISAALFILKTSNSRLTVYCVSAIVLCGVFVIGSFEYIREISRKPYVIQGYMFSSSILISDVNKLNNEGVLNHAKWSQIDDINDNNRIDAGREIFKLQCLCCHTINGIRNDIMTRTSHFTYEGLLAQLTGQGKVLSYMPPFIGTKDEKEALASYIHGGLHKKKLDNEPTINKKYELKIDVNNKNSEYVLLVWSTSAMRTISDCDKWFSIKYSGNTIVAQLIKKGSSPELISKDIVISYKVPLEYQTTSKYNEFWDYADVYFNNKNTEEDRIYLKKRNSTNGTMTFNESSSSYISPEIPVVPFDSEGDFTPYIPCRVEARSAGEGNKLLAEATVILPVSNEIGCGKCHAGGWKFDKHKTGISDETAQNILSAHDRINKTSLLCDAISGKPKMCKSCHSSSVSTKSLSLSAAIHGFHANYMHLEGEQACAACHPSSSAGVTAFYRGIHNSLGLTCVECHGTMAAHSAALLKHELNISRIKRLVKNIIPQLADTYNAINPRAPWSQQPDCLTCHKNFSIPSEYDAFNSWVNDTSALFSNRTDNIGIRCPACHGTAHALYPAVNPYSQDIDNTQPLQYTHKPYPIGSDKKCTTCHDEHKYDSMHHDNMLRFFRNR